MPEKVRVPTERDPFNVDRLPENSAAAKNVTRKKSAWTNGVQDLEKRTVGGTIHIHLAARAKVNSHKWRKRRAEAPI